MAPARMQVSETYSGSLLLDLAEKKFTTKKNEESIGLEREERKAKLETRAPRREEAGPSCHKELEKSESVEI